LGLIIITLAKGKWGLAVFAVAGGWLGLVGALRLARPGSLWYGRFYDEAKQQRASLRFARWECKACKRRFPDRGACEGHVAATHPELEGRAARKATKNRGIGIL